jgi:hypothetical protein
MIQNGPGNIPSLTEPGGECFVGLIPDLYRWTGWGGKDRFNLLVTDQRLVFDLITDKSRPWDAYATSNIEDVVISSRKNLVFALKEINFFQFVSGETVDHTCGRFEEIRGQLRLKTTGKKYCFYIPLRFERTAQDIFRRAGITFELVRTERRAVI